MLSKIAGQMYSPDYEFSDDSIYFETYTISCVVKIIDETEQIVGTGFLVRVSSFITASKVFEDTEKKHSIKTQNVYGAIPRRIYYHVEHGPSVSLAFVSSSFQKSRYHRISKN